MQQERAFDVLGIEPTSDLRVIRRAFVRLARIYHPDRFVDQSEDVRGEAERRMKQAIAAYDYLRNARRNAAKAATKARTPKTRDHDPWEEARRAREVIFARRAELERSRARWLLWEELERQAKERADTDARSAAEVVDDLRVVRTRPGEPGSQDEGDRWSLTQRLERARGSPDTPATTRKSF